MDVKKLAEVLICGRRLNREDDISFLLCEELTGLCQWADAIRSSLCGNNFELCAIINGKSGKCSEDCKFCAQSCRYETDAESYGFIPAEDAVREAEHVFSHGVERFSVVTAGRRLGGDDLDRSLEAFSAVREKCGIALCASHGLLDEEQLRRLKSAGVSRYHCNIETSRRNFPNICTTHTFDEKIKCIKSAQKSGLEVCSGGIIGMGETWDDRIDMAFTLSELGIRSVPINILTPIKGTPLGESEAPSYDEILRTIAIFRFILPDASIRLAGGRRALSDCGRKAFLSGANAAITGDMLTTSGNGIDSDAKMFTELSQHRKNHT